MNETKNILQIKNLNYSSTGIKFTDFNLEVPIEPGTINTIICKNNAASLLLKIISEVEENYEGDIQHTLQNKNIIYIPSKASSFPWLNVEENIKFVLDNSNLSDGTTGVKIQGIIDSVGLTGYENHFPDNRSLGFRFRISLARVLSLQPSLVLIDKPFSKMDGETKFEIYDLLKKIASHYNLSILLATNDLNEAIYLSDNMILLKGTEPEVITTINLKEEWQKMSDENRNDRQIKLKEKILKLFLENDDNFII